METSRGGNLYSEDLNITFMNLKGTLNTDLS